MNNVSNKRRMKKSAVILRILKYLLAHKGLLALAAILTLASNTLALAAPEISGRAIDAIASRGQVDFDKVYASSIKSTPPIALSITSAVFGAV